jgi:hypothetical protein
MKKLVLILLIGCPFSSSRANDILANGDFSQGVAHWKGDAKSLSTDPDLMDPAARNDTTPSLAGILIPMQSRWAKISQVFNTKETALDFTITYKTSSDVAFSDASAFPVTKTLQSLIGIPFQNSSETIAPKSWLVILMDPASRTATYIPFQPTLGSRDPQTATGSIPKLVAHEEKTFYIAFPPGQGTVTLLKVMLTPTQSTMEKSPNSDTSPIQRAENSLQ